MKWNKYINYLFMFFMIILLLSINSLGVSAHGDTYIPVVAPGEIQTGDSSITDWCFFNLESPQFQNINRHLGVNHLRYGYENAIIKSKYSSVVEGGKLLWLAASGNALSFDQDIPTNNDTNVIIKMNSQKMWYRSHITLVAPL